MQHQEAGEMIEFSKEDTEAIARIDLAALKPILPEDQFNALAKFVQVNQSVVGLNEGVTRQ